MLASVLAVVLVRVCTGQTVRLSERACPAAGAAPVVADPGYDVTAQGRVVDAETDRMRGRMGHRAHRATAEPIR